MIPAYKENISLKEVLSKDEPIPIRESIATIEDQVLQLREAVNYLKRENSRLKSDIQTLAHAINK